MPATRLCQYDLPDTGPGMLSSARDRRCVGLQILWSPAFCGQTTSDVATEYLAEVNYQTACFVIGLNATMDVEGQTSSLGCMRQRHRWC